MSCPFKNLLGEPKKGVHSTRMFGIAFADTLLTIILALVTTWITKLNFVISLFSWILMGEVLHILFGVQTQLLTCMGIKVNCTDSTKQSQEVRF